MTEKPYHDEKENIPNIGAMKLSKPPGLKPSCANPYLTNSNSKKNKQPKLKPQKQTNTSVRAGDWVCLICNNLNFSFRNECNRCAMQTKKQNYIQSLMLINDPQKLEASKNYDRAPLKDLTNQVINNQSDDRKVHRESDDDANHLFGIFQSPEVYAHHSEKSTEFDYTSNYGFVSAILLTPPRTKSQTTTNVFENTDSNQKDHFPPYRSPKELPSVSPILRKVATNDGPIKEQMLKNLHNKLLFEECLDERPLQMKKAASAIDHSTDYFNLEEINKYVTESFKNNEYDPVFSSGNGDSFYSDEKIPDSLVGNFHSLSVNSLDNFTSFGSPKLSANVSMSNSTKNMIYPSNSHLNAGPTNIGSPNNLQQAKTDEGSKKGKKEKKSDWICPHCGNLNYSFRTCCNRCQIIRQSDLLTRVELFL